LTRLNNADDLIVAVFKALQSNPFLMETIMSAGGWIGFGAAAVVVTGIAVVASLDAVRVGQNETVVTLLNRNIYEDNVPTGLNWYWATFGINKYEFVKIPHTTQPLTITAADKGSSCEVDCVNLTTGDQQTVTGSLTVPWRVKRVLDHPPMDRGRPISVAADLFLTRGFTDIHDIQEKLVAPAVINCMITDVNKTAAKDLIEKDVEIISTIQACVVPAIAKYGIEIPPDTQILNRGFGPSQEARASMKAYADARQAGQVADVLISNAPQRQEAALKSMEIFAAAWKKLEEAGIPESERTAIICLGDSNSFARPCVPGTATSGAVPSIGVSSGTQLQRPAPR